VEPLQKRVEMVQEVAELEDFKRLPHRGRHRLRLLL
jgi:hypothetical protein